MFCALFGSVDCLDYLISAQANVNQPDLYDRTALHHACAAGRQDMVIALTLRPETDFEARSCGGETPLMAAI